jgi:hypothetical protein
VQGHTAPVTVHFSLIHGQPFVEVLLRAWNPVRHWRGYREPNLGRGSPYSQALKGKRNRGVRAAERGHRGQEKATLARVVSVPQVKGNS